MPKKSRKPVLLISALAFAGVIVLFSSGLTYAHFSNRNVPVLSDIVEQVESTIVSQEVYAEKVQSEINETLFSKAKDVTNTAEKEGVVKSEISDDFFEHHLNVNPKTEVNSYTSMGEVEVAVHVPEQEGTPAMDIHGYT